MTTPTARFEHLLSSRARIGWGAPVATARPIASPRYEFGGGYPDPVSFPYDDMVEATARMMEAEGAQALTYGDPQGYRGLRELVCHKYRVFEGLEVTPENIFVGSWSGSPRNSTPSSSKTTRTASSGSRGRRSRPCTRWTAAGG